MAGLNETLIAIGIDEKYCVQFESNIAMMDIGWIDSTTGMERYLVIFATSIF